MSVKSTEPLASRLAKPAVGNDIAKVADLDLRNTPQAIDTAYATKAKWAARTGTERTPDLRNWHASMFVSADDLASIRAAKMGEPWPRLRSVTALQRALRRDL